MDDRDYLRNLSLIEQLEPHVRWAARRWIEVCFQRGLKFRISEARRTQARQMQLYAQGRTTKGPIVTHIDGVRVKSNHQLGLAVDVYPLNCTYAEIEGVATLFGITHPFTGPPFVDLPHFEMIHVESKPDTDPQPVIRTPSATIRRLDRLAKQEKDPVKRKRILARKKRVELRVSP